jgi:hypothetical protein
MTNVDDFQVMKGDRIAVGLEIGNMQVSPEKSILKDRVRMASAIQSAVKRFQEGK